MVFYGSDDLNDLDRTNGEDSNDSYGGVPTTDLTLCIGLVVAFIIFLAVVLIIIKLLKKKSNQHRNSGYTLTPAGKQTYNNIFPTAMPATP